MCIKSVEKWINILINLKISPRISRLIVDNYFQVMKYLDRLDVILSPRYR